MVRSAPQPPLFSARNVVAAVVTLLTLALVARVVAQWIPPDPDVPAFDSYSGTVIGFRGIHDLLEELGQPVRRSGEPPPAWLTEACRVVMLQPSTLALELEKDYLRQIQAWVRDGGELVLVSYDLGPNTVRRTLSKRHGAQSDRIVEFFGTDELLAGFGLDDLKVEGSARELGMFHEESEDWRHVVTDHYADFRRLNREFPLTASGSLAPIAVAAPRLRLPGDGLRRFAGESVAKADGAIAITTSHDDVDTVIALEYAVGAGTVTLVSEPVLLTNLSLSYAQNAVAAYHLVAGRSDLPVIIDEYYHGSLAAASALQLLTLRPFSIISLMVLLTVALWAWSQWVRFGPPQPEQTVNRRSILEYIDAMARLYRRGGKEAFVLKWVRDGTLDRLRHDLQLPAGIPPHQLIHRLALRDAAAAAELDTLLSTIDATLASQRDVSRNQLIDLQGKLESCRWKNSPPGHRPMPAPRMMA